MIIPSNNAIQLGFNSSEDGRNLGLLIEDRDEGGKLLQESPST
jgi:hypothetical protein